MRSELSPFSIDRKIISTLLQLMKERDYLESVLANGLSSMNSREIPFYIDEELSVTGKEIWLIVSRTHLTKEGVPNIVGWNQYPFVLPWENRASPDKKLWLVKLKDGRFITAEYNGGWHRWPDEKIAFFRDPSEAPTNLCRSLSDTEKSNLWLPYPEHVPVTGKTYEVFISTGEVRTATWRGEDWSYFNAKVKAFKEIEEPSLI